MGSPGFGADRRWPEGKGDRRASSFTRTRYRNACQGGSGPLDNCECEAAVVRKPSIGRTRATRSSRCRCVTAIAVAGPSPRDPERFPRREYFAVAE
jgi:hypothetical protein